MSTLAAAIVGHMVGDFVFQSDWMATHKAHRSSVCAVHVLVYVICVAGFTRFAWPWWVYLLIGAHHFITDRFRCARLSMDVMGQRGFATGPLAPWSVVVIDQTMHLIALWWGALIYSWSLS